ncbi:MAG: glycosyltransferase family 4 protein [Candidatus Omnitrophota bacterium]|nr:glycosyltransferase family 4 protein [Candidatus Omnitrophota bacterium]
MARVEALKKICSKVIVITPPVERLRKRGGLMKKILGEGNYRRLTRFFNIITKPPERVYGAHWYIAAFHDALGGIDLSVFDLIQIERSELAWWFAGRGKIKKEIRKIVTFHDVNSILEQRIYEQVVSPRWKIFKFTEWRKTIAYEKKVAYQYDNCIVTSKKDAENLLSIYPKAKISIVPNGTKIDYFRANKSHAGDIEPLSLIFCGSMQWYPNEDAMLFFCKEILPLLRKDIPKVKLYIVGTNPSERVKMLSNDFITVTGSVDDVRPYVTKSAVYIVPIRIGGGTRLKILEALSMGKPVVTTSIGCEGLNVVNRKHLLIADSPIEFANNIKRVFFDKKLCNQLTQHGNDLVNKYDWDVISKSLEKAWYETIN